MPETSHQANDSGTAPGSTSADQTGPQRQPPVVSVVSTTTSTALRVDYDGTRPPLELFFVWSSLGWRAPAPAGPPKDAIDWGTPDPAKGTSYTIRPFPATGTATLDAVSIRDAEPMVRSALDAAVRLGCIVDRPDPIDEIDLREATLRADHPAAARSAAAETSTAAPAAAADEPHEPSEQPVVDLTGTDADRGGAGRERIGARLSLPSRGRRTRGGALARVRAIVPTAELEAVEQAAQAIDARVSHEDEPTPEDHPDGPRSRVTFELPASAADSAMRVLGSVATGTPTIEIVTARDLADRGR